MDVAIRFEGIIIGEDKILFKPVGVMRGKYNEQDDFFIDECGCKYCSIDGINIYARNYFSDPINFKDLKEIYGDDKRVNEILSLYFSEFNEIYYLGYFDDVSGTIKAVEMNFEEIRQTFAEMENGLNINSKNESVIGFDLENNESFVFDLKTLKELKEYQTVEEIRAFIDKLLAAGEYIKSCVKQEQAQQESQRQEKQGLSLKKEESQKFNLKEMRDFVLSEIVAQDEAVKRITTRILTNFISSDYRRKSHLLIMGGTGTGKSKTIELVCQYLNIPFAKVDATNYTQAGYVGRSVDEMLAKLIASAGGDIELAQKGILVVDEIDKKANNGDSSGVATKAVLDTLLQITGRGTVEVDIIEDRTKKTIDFDTSDLTVILTGAFEGIEKYANKDSHRQIGFGADLEPKQEEVEITPQMLIKYGMTPELMGRIKCIVPLDKFDENGYYKILRYSKSSPLLVEKNFLEKDKGIKFTYTVPYLKEVARQAKELDQGARGADVVVARTLENIHERILNGEPIKELKLTKKTALNNKEYYVKY